MNRALVSFVSAVLLIATALQMGVYAQETKDKRAELTVPWDEFKQLLDLDDNEIVISLRSFQKLLEQTGTGTTPPHTIQHGNVVLTRAEFAKLIDQMKPPVSPHVEPPFPYLMTKAIYSGKLGTNNTSFNAAFDVHVLKRDAYVKVPILPQHIALADIEVGGKQALIVSENGYHHVVLPRAGEHVVTASFSIKSSLENGPHKIDLLIQQTPITLLKLELPMKNIDVEIPQAQQVATSVSGQATIVSAVIAQGTSISVRWRKKVEAMEKIPPKLYSEVHHLVAVDDDALKTTSDILFTILHSEVDAVQLAIPDNVNVLTVSGEGVGEWQETTQDDQRLLNVPFTYGKKGTATVRVTTETAYSEAGMTNEFRGLRTIGTVRETGFIGIELATSAEFTVNESEGLETVVVQKLPPALVERSARPLIMGFKYLKHPFSLVFDIKKHDKIAVPVATINSASVVTLFTEDGKVVHRLVYQIRNAAKQFLEIQLPAKSDVWSVFVGGRPVESSVNGQGKLLVPLIRSRSENNRLDTFPVEVIYATVQDRFSSLGSRNSQLPAVDLLTSQLIWSVYLPNDYSYLYFKSTLEKEEIIRGLNILSHGQRQYDENAMKEVRLRGGKKDRDELKDAYMGQDYRSNFRNVPVEEDQLSSQLDAELEFSGRLEKLAGAEAPPIGFSKTAATTGVLPIQIRIPTGGQIYRFARTIIKTEDPLTFSVVYTRLWVVEVLKWIIYAILALIIYLKRKRLGKLWRWAAATLHDLAGLLKARGGSGRKYARSTMTPFVLLGLAVVSWFVSGLLTALFLFLFWVSAVYHVLLYWRKKAGTAAGPEGEVG